ncbi:MAG: MFS transporter, partial [Planctomycetes bacterium]|nr:MFS transporter [Planctomycetota bacterium]
SFQIAAMVGPALGGLIIGGFGSSPRGFAVVYLISAGCFLAQFALTWPIVPRREKSSGRAVALRGLAAGVRFVWRTKLILAAITLDLLAVLFGGATALLPMFARDRLHVGAVGLGWMRAAPALGAFLMVLWIAHRPPMRHAGRNLLWAVAGFGAATIIFGLSRWFWLSLAMLLLTGAFDNISVVIRHTLVQVLTPDEMRGRVSAVNNLFIGLSNEMGDMESGLTAALLGPVLSVVGGGVGTILVVLGVAWMWPQVRRFGSLTTARPEESSEEIQEVEQPA